MNIQTEFEVAETRIRSALADPEGAQEELLRDIMQVNRDTEVGRRYDFASIGDLASYRSRVPVIGYAQMDDDVERMMDGARDVLFEGEATYFGRTSGTTGAPKHIAFNPRVRAEYVNMLGPLVARFERDFPGASGTTLLLTAPFNEEQTRTGVSIGYGSGFVRRCLDEHPYFRFAPDDVYETRDLDIRTYVLLLLALSRPMRGFAGMFPVALVNLLRRATDLVEPLADDLARGRLAAGPAGVTALAPICGPRLRPLPDAARRLRDIVRTNGRFVPDEYWTTVSALHVWKGGMAKHGLQELQAMFRSADIRAMASGSTEASLMVPLEPSWIGGVPALRSTVIEFLPEGATPHASEVVTLRDLEEDRGYRLVVTNHRGMYRYAMEDVFVIEGRYDHGIPFLRLAHRVGIISNLAGEKLSEAQVSHAIDEAIRATGVVPKLFQVAPERMTGSGAVFRYVVLLELEEAAPRELLQQFLDVVQRDLLQANDHYKLFHDLGSLAPAVLCQMTPGYFLATARKRSGVRDLVGAQLKLVALDRELLERDDATVITTVALD